MSSVSPARSSGWVLGRIGGTPIVVAPTSALLGLVLAGTWYPVVDSVLGDLGIATVLGVVLATVVGVALSVLLHELAHGLTGTLLGRRPTRYELYLWGGRTSFGAVGHWAPWKEVLTTLAGPATNALLWLMLDRVFLHPVGAVGSETLFVVALALAWVNLALAVFNILPALPLDGGHALAALVAQVTGRTALGQKVAAWGGVLVSVGVVWYWILEPLLLRGVRPQALNLMIVVLVLWSILGSSWRVLGLGSGARAAARLDLRRLCRPVAVVAASAPVAEVRQCLASGMAVVVVVDSGRLLGTIDAAGLAETGLEDPTGGGEALASQICRVLPAAAVTTSLGGAQAAQALKAARAVSRWLLLVENGNLCGAVPTGAR